VSFHYSLVHTTIERFVGSTLYRIKISRSGFGITLHSMNQFLKR